MKIFIMFSTNNLKMIHDIRYRNNFLKINGINRYMCLDGLQRKHVLGLSHGFESPAQFERI